MRWPRRIPKELWHVQFAQREVTRFLWWPRCAWSHIIHRMQWRWLERAVLVEEWIGAKWSPAKWVDSLVYKA
jgi:hypothetical protein